jgi:hypothetical protein
MAPTGYSHPLYAASFSQFGTPFELQNSHGWLLQRSIPGADFMDAMGCYPIFSCEDWFQLRTDLDKADPKLVSIILVSDPFGNYDKNVLLSCFHHVLPFKEHFIVDLEQPLTNYASKSHLRFSNRAQRKMQIEVCADPLSQLDRWCALFQKLAIRKSISGIRAFSRSAFETQLAVPGIVLFKAFADGEVIGLDWWYVQGNVAHGHLAALSERGYELHAGYALKLAILEYFKGRVRWVNLGGVPGDSGNLEHEGLAAFKRGWSCNTRTAYLCGRILNKPVYADLVMKQKFDINPQYFPYYRQGELL